MYKNPRSVSIILSVLLVIALLFSIDRTSNAQGVSDVAIHVDIHGSVKDLPFAKDIEKLVSKGYEPDIDAPSAMDFNPNAPLTRGQLAVMIAKIMINGTERSGEKIEVLSEEHSAKYKYQFADSPFHSRDKKSAFFDDLIWKHGVFGYADVCEKAGILEPAVSEMLGKAGHIVISIPDVEKDGTATMNYYKPESKRAVFNPDEYVTRTEFIVAMIKLADYASKNFSHPFFKKYENILKEAEELNVKFTRFSDISMEPRFYPGFVSVACREFTVPDPNARDEYGNSEEIPILKMTAQNSTILKSDDLVKDFNGDTYATRSWAVTLVSKSFVVPDVTGRLLAIDPYSHTIIVNTNKGVNESFKLLDKTYVYVDLEGSQEMIDISKFESINIDKFKNSIISLYTVPKRREAKHSDFTMKIEGQEMRVVGFLETTLERPFIRGRVVGKYIPQMMPEAEAVGEKPAEEIYLFIWDMDKKQVVRLSLANNFKVLRMPTNVFPGVAIRKLKEQKANPGYEADKIFYDRLVELYPNHNWMAKLTAQGSTILDYNCVSLQMGELVLVPENMVAREGSNFKAKVIISEPFIYGQLQSLDLNTNLVLIQKRTDVQRVAKSNFFKYPTPYKVAIKEGRSVKIPLGLDENYKLIDEADNMQFNPDGFAMRLFEDPTVLGKDAPRMARVVADETEDVRTTTANSLERLFDRNPLTGGLDRLKPVFAYMQKDDEGKVVFVEADIDLSLKK